MFFPKQKEKMGAKRKRGGRGQGKYVLKRAKKGLTTTQAKAAKRLIKKELRKDNELKYFSIARELELGILGTSGANQYYRSYNLFYEGVARGAGDHQFLGDKIRWKGIGIKYRITNGYFAGPGFTYSNQPITIDMYIVRVPHFYTGTSLPLNTMYNDTTSDPATWFMANDCKVLTKKTIRFTPQKAGDATTKQGKIWLKRDQNIEYKGFDINANLKNELNYYLVMINRSVAGERTNMYFTWQNYFVDS